MKRSVSLEFNENISMTAIRAKQTPIHESLITEISFQIRNIMPRSPELFVLWGNTQIATKLADPDLQMLWDSDAGAIRLLAVEVSFSQSSDNLKEKIKELLQKSTVRVAIMVDVKEKPIYKNPLGIQKNINIFNSARSSQTGDFESLLQSSCKDRPLFSPVFLYGLRWTGEFTASIQVFSKDVTSGEIIAKTEKTVSPKNVS
jgi:hypothetical protein